MPQLKKKSSTQKRAVPGGQCPFNRFNDGLPYSALNPDRPARGLPPSESSAQRAPADPSTYYQFPEFPSEEAPEPQQPAQSRCINRFSLWRLLVSHPRHVVTYFVCVALFSISFLVFVNATASFLVTERLRQGKDGSRSRRQPWISLSSRDSTGTLVGTLGFADEIGTLLSCPIWGLLSDRIGIRPVVVFGYSFVALGLVLLGTAQYFTEMLIARVVFSLGASAMTTMITAILPVISGEMPIPEACPVSDMQPAVNVDQSVVVDHRESVSSEATDATDETITPARFAAQTRVGGTLVASTALSFRIAGVLGTFAGFGALLALFFFLPLPAFFQSIGESSSNALVLSYELLTAVALALAVICFFGLKGLPGENKQAIASPHRPQKVIPYHVLLRDAVVLGFKSPQIGLGYLSSFVARGSSVCISLFIPMLVNVYFRRSGSCAETPEMNASKGDRACPEAYATAAALTGTSQLVALLSAPLFGYMSSRMTMKCKKLFWIPLGLAGLVGVVGFGLMATVENPDPFGKGRKGAHPAVFLVVSLLGLAQIGVTVCGLGMLSGGIQEYALQEAHRLRSNRVSSAAAAVADAATGQTSADEVVEHSPDLGDLGDEIVISTHKGTIGSVSSLCGAAAILLVTKTGGAAFDVNWGAPFWGICASFGLLSVVVFLVGAKGMLFGPSRLRI